MKSKSQKRKVSRFGQWYNSFSSKITRAAGRPAALLIAFLIILIWGLTGPIFGYSDTWQLVINTGTTIITFLMVFIIQQSQNKDTTAIQLKLNELIACNDKASNRLVDIEDLTEEELLALKKFYIKLSNLAGKEDDIFRSHSLDEADDVHEVKRNRKPASKKSPASKS